MWPTAQRLGSDRSFQIYFLSDLTLGMSVTQGAIRPPARAAGGNVDLPPLSARFLVPEDGDANDLSSMRHWTPSPRSGCCSLDSTSDVDGPLLDLVLAAGTMRVPAPVPPIRARHIPARPGGLMGAALARVAAPAPALRVEPPWEPEVAADDSDDSVGSSMRMRMPLPRSGRCTPILPVDEDLLLREFVPGGRMTSRPPPMRAGAGAAMARFHSRVRARRQVAGDLGAVAGDLAAYSPRDGTPPLGDRADVGPNDRES